jgi:membrane peptidoglycan carboxypeptidase
VYASDGRTLIARFDTDPRESCLRVPRNEWGFFCGYLVAWWQAQLAFGTQPAQRLDRLRRGGYRIVASLDVGLQAAAKRHVEEQVPTGDRNALTLVAVQPGTGRIKAMAVNRNFRPGPLEPSASGTADWSRRRRQLESPDTVEPLLTGGEQMAGYPAGSTFMMFTIAAALDKGIPLDYAIDTKPRYESRYLVQRGTPADCGSGHWCAENFGDLAYRAGRRTMWQALGHSVVTYFVPLQERVGADAVVDVAQRLGIRFRTGNDEQYASAPLASQWGPFTLGVSATTSMDLANAYATLAADGTRCDPLPVQQIIDARGQPVSAADPRCTTALRPEVARAALDAGRCAVGDRSAFGDVCGAGTVPAASVRAVVNRPVAGQLGVDDRNTTSALAIASPQLATAAIVADPGCPVCSMVGPSAAALVAAAVADTQRDGLAPLPYRDFTPPPRQLAIGG